MSTRPQYTVCIDVYVAGIQLLLTETSKTQHHSWPEHLMLAYDDVFKTVCPKTSDDLEHLLRRITDLRRWCKNRHIRCQLRPVGPKHWRNWLSVLHLFCLSRFALYLLARQERKIS